MSSKDRSGEGRQAIEWLNYHHLLRFRMIAREGGLTRAARVLHVSASTLSEQVRELEEWLGTALFERRGHALVLTDAGRAALDHAEAIHQSGSELLDLFRRSKGEARRVLRIGAVGTLSKNLQFDFIEPLLSRSDVLVTVSAAPFENLIDRLRAHELDVVLSHGPAPRGDAPEVFSHVLGEVPAYLVGRMESMDTSAGFPGYLKGVPLFLPSRQTPLRDAFELQLAEAGLVPDVRAEVDDMALLRLLALSGKGLALTSAIVVKRELDQDDLLQVLPTPGLAVRFFAVTVRRRLAAPWLEQVVSGFRERLKRFNRVMLDTERRSRKVARSGRGR